jgi:hypothetical protein
LLIGGSEMSVDVISEAVACTFCGHRYLHPCADLTKAQKCGNYEYMTTRGSVGRINAPIVDQATADALRMADELNKLMGVKNDDPSQPSRASYRRRSVFASIRRVAMSGPIIDLHGTFKLGWSRVQCYGCNFLDIHLGFVTLIWSSAISHE